MTLNLPQSRAMEALRKAVAHARAAGLFLVADADGMCIRVTTTREAPELDDLRVISRSIQVDGGCGGAIIPRRTGNGSG